MSADIIVNGPTVHADVIVRNRTTVEVSTGRGPVTSVNGKKGEVVLNAEDVGADPEGSAAAALFTAQAYTDALTEAALADAQNYADSLVAGLENAGNKDASNGYVGLTLFKINFKNVLNTIVSFFTNSNTAERTYTFPDKSMTIGDELDIRNASIPPVIPGEWRGLPGITPMTGAAWNGFIRTIPVPVGIPHTVTHVRVPVTTGVANENIRLAIYADNGNGLPGALIEQSGNLSASVAGEVSFQFTTPRALTGRFVHIAFQSSHASIAIRSWTSCLFYMPRTAGSVPYISRRVAQAFGAFPDPFPASTEVGTGNQFMGEVKVAT